MAKGPGAKRATPKAGRTSPRTRAGVGRLRNRSGGFDTIINRVRGNRKAAAARRIRVAARQR